MELIGQTSLNLSSYDERKHNSLHNKFFSNFQNLSITAFSKQTYVSDQIILLRKQC